MPDLIDDHVWRPPHYAKVRYLRITHTPRLEKPCEFMNCRRPSTDHARAVRLRDRLAQ